nr:T9SS type A sorting domain-containing protein [Cytophagales bacterium]
MNGGYNILSTIRIFQDLSRLYPGNWDSWGTQENILHKGNAEAIGEPSLTQYGDISFLLGYKNTFANDPTDVYDLDPWFLPVNVITSLLPNIELEKKHTLKISPNPFSLSTTLESNYPLQNATLYCYNSFGQLVKQLENIAGHSFILYRGDLTSGVYFVVLIDEIGEMISDRILIL